MRLTDGREPVGDDNRGAPADHRIDGVLNEPLRIRIHGGGGLVQDQNGRVI